MYRRPPIAVFAWPDPRALRVACLRGGRGARSRCLPPQGRAVATQSQARSPASAPEQRVLAHVDVAVVVHVDADQVGHRPGRGLVGRVGPRREVLSVAVEHLHLAVAEVREVDEAIGTHGDALGVVEAIRAVTGAAPLGQELAVGGVLDDAVGVEVGRVDRAVSGDVEEARVLDLSGTRTFAAEGEEEVAVGVEDLDDHRAGRRRRRRCRRVPPPRRWGP